MLHRQLWRQRNIILLILGFVIYLNLFHEDLGTKSSEKESLLDGEELEGVELEDFINTNSKKLDEEGLKRIISSLQQRLKMIDSSFVTSPDFENLQDQTSPVSSTSSSTSSPSPSSPSSTVSISTSSKQNSISSTDATITSSPSSTSSTSSRKSLFSHMYQRKCTFYTRICQNRNCNRIRRDWLFFACNRCTFNTLKQKNANDRINRES